MGEFDNDKFEQDSRRRQEIRCRPYADRIYRDIWGPVVIERYERGHGDTEMALLDKEHAIDVRIKTPCGMQVTGQEKFLSEHYAKYGTITIEYEQDPKTKEPGDWFRMAPQLYFVGYEKPADGFYPWVLINVAQLVKATNEGRINWTHRQNNNGSARASFKSARIDELPSECVIAGQWNERVRGIAV